MRQGENQVELPRFFLDAARMLFPSLLNFRSLPTLSSNCTQFRKLIPLSGGTQTCELPSGTFILAEWVPKMLRCATREKLFEPK
ncbi:MAG TPA: hypothetical protein DCZ04_05450 [Syntrophorhabdus aromaticivorans]|nr:hypothetical protein [Syntrophorhabdus aromaticivorans]